MGATAPGADRARSRDFVDAGRVKVFCVDVNNHESFLNERAHPLHRSWLQRMFDEYIRDEVIPYIRDQLPDPRHPDRDDGASLGAYHAANTLFHYPHLVKRCYGLSGVYDMSAFMGGMYDDNFYFNNPVDYMANLTDPWMLEQLATCEIQLATGTGPFEKSGESYAMSAILARKGIRHHLDDWGPLGGHDWPYWKEQLRECISRW